MKVRLLRLDGLDVAMLGAQCCVSKDMPTEPDPKSLLKAIDSGHLSVLEHAVASFAIEGISRVTEIQLVRHRLASYSIRSGRFTDLTNCECIVPESVDEWNKVGPFSKTALDSVATYCELTECGIKGEDARYILPQGMATNLVMTVNLRELLHMCQLRRCDRAQTEIRELFDEIAERTFRELMKQFDLKATSPECVQDLMFRLTRLLAPQCHALGYCPEAKSCGKAPSLSDLRSAYAIVRRGHCPEDHNCGGWAE